MITFISGIFYNPQGQVQGAPLIIGRPKLPPLNATNMTYSKNYDILRTWQRSVPALLGHPSSVED